MGSIIVLSKGGFLCELTQNCSSFHFKLTSMRCTGTTKEGDQCKRNALTGHECCHLHVICQGSKRDGDPCKAKAVKHLNYLYCREDHDPRNKRSTDPKDFRIDGLCHSKRDAVLEYRDGKDAYTGHALEGIQGMDLDHTVELHIIRDAFDAILKHGMNFEEKKRELLDFTKGSVVNEDSNLNFTSKPINEWKFKAFDKFQKDYRRGTGRQEEEGLFPYLQDEYKLKVTNCKRKFERSISKRIQKEVKTSYQNIIWAFEDEQPLHAEMMEKLYASLASMKLH